MLIELIRFFGWFWGKKEIEVLKNNIITSLNNTKAKPF